MPQNLLMFLHMVPLFRCLRYEELLALASKLKKKDFSKGEIIIEEGKAGGEALYIIDSGHLSVLGGENQQNLATLSRYNFFGEISLLTGEPHSATIRALTDGELLVLDKKDFEELEKQKPEVVLGLSKVLSYKLRSLVDGKPCAEKKAKIILVISALSKGGTSVLSANLAASIARQIDEKTVLLDLNVVPGSVSTLLKCIPNKTAGEVFKENLKIDFADFQEIACTHESGLKVLSVGKEGEMDERVFPSLKQVLNEYYDYVVVDVSLQNIALIEKIFEFGDQILFLVPDKQDAAAHSLELLNDLLKINPQNRKEILVGGVCRSGETPQYVRKDFDFYLHFEEGPLENFLISGKPFVGTHARSRIARKIDALARRVCGRRIGLALSSGMAQGLAHIGVLKVFEKENLPVDLMAGTSGGAVYGSAFAAGIPMRKVREALKKNLKKLLWFYIDFNLLPYSGMVKGRSLKGLFESVIGGVDFKDLEIPFKVVSADLSTGEIVVLDEGKVGDALRASFAIPGIFNPYKCKNRFLVDGAAVSPVPVGVVSQSGADIIMAVDVNTNPGLVGERKEGGGLKRALERLFPAPFVFDILMSSRAMTSYKLSELDAAKADLVIRPKVERFHWRDYASAPEIIAEGEKAAYEAIPRIKNMLKH